MINVILQFLGLDLFNIKLSENFYQNIQNGLRVNFHFFQNLNLCKTLTNTKCHLTISQATSCQYTNLYAKFHHSIPLSSRDRAIFTFSEFGARQNLDRWKIDISQSFGLDLDNINVYAEVYQTIPLSSRDKAIFTFSEFGARWYVSFCNSLTFFRIWTSAKSQPTTTVIWQSHGVQLVNINVYAKFHHNIPLSSRDSAIISFSELRARQSLGQWKMSFRNLLG